MILTRRRRPAVRNAGGDNEPGDTVALSCLDGYHVRQIPAVGANGSDGHGIVLNVVYFSSDNWQQHSVRRGIGHLTRRPNGGRVGQRMDRSGRFWILLLVGTRTGGNRRRWPLPVLRSARFRDR